jgi:hypothetical protein
MFLYSLAESFVDNVIRDKVSEPAIGSVLYCDLAGGLGEHSGIYIGNDQIVHLNGNGRIEIANPYQFLNRLGGNNPAVTIYVSCTEETPVGCKIAAQRARSMVGESRNYNVILDNCHQFTSGCLTGNWENADNFVMFLKLTTSNTLGSNNWRSWEHKVY